MAKKLEEARLAVRLAFNAIIKARKLLQDTEFDWPGSGHSGI